MVSPRKLEQKKIQNEVIKSHKPLEKYVFYLDIKNNATCKDIEDKIKKFGGHVEVFLTEAVTHIVSDAPCGPGNSSPRTPQTPNPTAPPQQWLRGRRTDAMLERAACLHHNSQRIPPQHNLPVWSLLKIKQFLSRIGSLAYKKVLKEPFIKFESVDRKSRAVYKELSAWPELHLSGEHSGCPFTSPDKFKQSANNTKPKVAKVQSSTTRRRMTKETKGRIKEQVEVLQKQSGYCEICRVDYNHLPDHEQSASHTAFVKNCSNFLSLDSLINSGADVEAFLKMNTTITSNHSIERRSLRNIIKVHQEDNGNGDGKKQLEVFCNGGSPRRQTTPQMSPALSDSKHYLRSKGSEKKDYRNGSVSPHVNYEKTDVGKMNGKVEELERCSPVQVNKGKKAKYNMKWRATTSPEPSEASGDTTHSYYKVVGMSTKLRSSASFTPAPPPPNHNTNICNGNNMNPGLVVKFKRVRKSELSVLSDEAENFMFPKKDDSETEDERESSQSSSRDPSMEIKTESIIKEEEDSQDSCGSESTRRNPRRRTHVESYRDSIDYFGLEYTPAPRSKRKTSSVTEEKETLTQLQKCLKWENGHLRASDQVEKLTYAFEQLPNSEPWYNSFVRQDEGRLSSKSALPYLTCYRKPPVLPYEMAELPPLKPNCCILSHIKKPEPKPARLYGTRGMKRKKIKVDPVFNISLNPRKSPREHASTLAILGGLIHGKRSKLSGSEDSKSLPSIAEEETSSDAPSIPLLNPVFEASRQLHQLLSSVFQDDADEIPVDSMEGIHIERSKTNDVLNLIDNYEDCEQLDNTVKEICESAQPERSKPRKGYKFKKKNKTGWPNKKKVSKKDSRSSSREGSAGVQGSSNFNRLDENSITSISELDENGSISDKLMDNIDDNAVSVSEWQGQVDLQPVVRVLKMEVSPSRRLRSAAALSNKAGKDKRKLRRRRRPNR